MADAHPPPWDPWQALSSLGDRVWLAYVPLDGPLGRWERDEQGDVILLEARLSRRARRVVLAHELIHAERGVAFPHASRATMQAEEERVRREVARRLVPPGRLRAFLSVRGGSGSVSVGDVADEFDVTDAVAELACHMLRLGE